MPSRLAIEYLYLLNSIFCNERHFQRASLASHFKRKKKASNKFSSSELGGGEKENFKYAPYGDYPCYMCCVMV